MANSFNAASSSSPRMTRSCKYRKSFSSHRWHYCFYVCLLSLPYPFISLKVQKDVIRVVFFTPYHSGFNFPSMSYFYDKFCVSSRYHCYLSYNFFHMGNHTDSCQPVPFLNNFSLLSLKWSFSVVYA